MLQLHKSAGNLVRLLKSYLFSNDNFGGGLRKKRRIGTSIKLHVVIFSVCAESIFCH